VCVCVCVYVCVVDPAVVCSHLTPSPVCASCSQGHLHVVWLLLQHGFSSGETDEYGNSSLHVACSGGHFDIVRAITATGCDPKARNTFGNDPTSLAGAPALYQYMLNISKAERCQDSAVGACAACAQIIIVGE
jgi:ankyrin repeat protein